MKCMECGFTGNSWDDVQCIQCGNPYANGETQKRMDHQSREDERDPKPGSDLNEQKTKLGTAYEGRDITRKTTLGRNKESASDASDSSNLSCSKCDYPLRIGQDICPHCSPVASAVSDTPMTAGHVKGPVSSGGRTRRLEEFIPERQKTTVRFEPVNSSDHPVLESRDFPFRLARKDLDANDDSISSSGHLFLFKEVETGSWKLRNEASNKALFVQVEGDVTVNSGTVILVGQHKLYRILIQD